MRVLLFTFCYDAAGIKHPTRFTTDTWRWPCSYQNPSVSIRVVERTFGNRIIINMPVHMSSQMRILRSSLTNYRWILSTRCVLQCLPSRIIWMNVVSSLIIPRHRLVFREIVDLCTYLHMFYRPEGF